MRTKETKGITLVALAVTITVLVILVSVTANVLLGDNGIIESVNDRISTEKEKMAREEVRQIVMEYGISNDGETLDEFLQALVPEKFDEVQRINDMTLLIKRAGYTIEINEEAKDFSIVVEPYVGIFDGMTHDAVSSLSVTPNDAKIEYSTDGKNFSDTMPTITDASSLFVTVRVSKNGYKTTTVTKTAKVEKATGTLSLSATSTITTITVDANATYSSISSDKIGTIEYRFSKDDGITWSEYQSSGKYTFNGLYDIEEKTYNIKIETRGSNINNIVQGIDVTTKKNEKYYADTADFKLFRAEGEDYGYRDFFKKYAGATAAGVMYSIGWKDEADNVVGYAPILVSDKESAVEYYSTHSEQIFSALGSIDYHGKKFFYCNREHWVQCSIWPNCPEHAVEFINTYDTPFEYDIDKHEEAARKLLDLYFEN